LLVVTEQIAHEGRAAEPLGHHRRAVDQAVIQPQEVACFVGDRALQIERGVAAWGLTKRLVFGVQQDIGVRYLAADIVGCDQRQRDGRDPEDPLTRVGQEHHLVAVGALAPRSAGRRAAILGYRGGFAGAVDALRTPGRLRGEPVELKGEPQRVRVAGYRLAGRAVGIVADIALHRLPGREGLRDRVAHVHLRHVEVGHRLFLDGVVQGLAGADMPTQVLAGACGRQREGMDRRDPHREDHHRGGQQGGDRNGAHGGRAWHPASIAAAPLKLQNRGELQVHAAHRRLVEVEEALADP